MSWLEAPVAGFGLVYLFIKVDFWNKKMQFYFDVDTLWKKVDGHISTIFRIESNGSLKFYKLKYSTRFC